MTSPAKLAAAKAAVKPLIDADIAKGEEMAPSFIRPRVDQEVQAHRAQIDAMVDQIIETAFAAADKVPD